jgi:16S rRNA (guanine527-N7)-methyltransferase
LSLIEIAVNLERAVEQSGIIIDAHKLELFTKYYQELVFWNRQINLVSERSIGEIVERHFVDSLTPLHFLKNVNMDLIDLGSGGGFPGIPLKIMLPEMRLSLVDSSRKKTSFLSQIVSILNLTETKVIRSRIEELLVSKEFAGKFDTVISRAAFNLGSLIKFSSVFLKQGGLLLAMRGPEFREDFIEVETTAQEAGMKLTGEFSQNTVNNHSSRKIIVYNRL